jgi:hypothetical protein
MFLADLRLKVRHGFRPALGLMGVKGIPGMGKDEPNG